MPASERALEMKPQNQLVYEFATENFTLGLAADARLAWLRQATDGRELLQPGVPLCKIRLHNGRESLPDSLDRRDALWRFSFPGLGWLDLRIEAKKGGYLRIALVEQDLPQAERLVFCQFSPLPQQYLGKMAGMASDEQSGVGMRSLSLKVNTDFQPRLFQAWSLAEDDFSQAGVGLFAGPRDKLPDSLKAMTLQEAVPFSPHGGAWSGESALNRGSYLFADVEAKDIERWIEICRRGSFDFLHFHYWWQTLGHYAPRKEHFPGGLAEMKACCDKVRQAGLRAGMHTLTGCIGCEGNNIDAWISPVPSPSLIATHSYTLRQDINPHQTHIELEQCPVAGHDLVYTYSGNGNVLRIGGELLQYAEISREKPYAFKRCTRGAFGTRPAEHRAGARVDYLQQRYLAFYPEPDSALAGALAEHIAAIYNECNMEMIYFDGSEGMRTRYAIDAMRWKIFTLLHGGLSEASEHGHNSWWLHSRLGAMDSPVWGTKRFVDMHLERARLYRKTDLMEPQMGWWSVLGAQRDFRGQHIDEIEYFAVKNLALDSPMAVQTVAVNEHAHWVNGRVWELITLLGWYERMRKARYFTEQTLQRLTADRAEFRLRLNQAGQWRFFPLSVSKHRFSANSTAPNESWIWHNDAPAQPLCLRLEALYAADLDKPGQTLIEWSSPKGHLSETAAEAVELRSSVLPAKPGLAQGSTVRIQAENQGTTGRGAWACLSVKFVNPYLDLSDCEALSVWIKGDGSDVLMNFQIAGPREYGSLLSDHYVRIDFKGWRRFELLFRERDSELAADSQWPYGLETGNYSIYRTPLTRRFRQHVEKISVYVNNIPAGGKADLAVGHLRGLPCRACKLEQPTVMLNGQELCFPVQMSSGQFIEMEGAHDCALYDERGFLLRRFRAQGVQQSRPGPRQISLQCKSGELLQPRMELTMFSLGKPFGEKNAWQDIDWGQLQREYELPRQISAFDGWSNHWRLLCHREQSGDPDCQPAGLELEIKANHIPAGLKIRNPVFFLNGEQFCFPVELQNGQLLCCKDHRSWRLFDADGGILQQGVLPEAIPPLSKLCNEVGTEAQCVGRGDFRITLLLCKTYRHPACVAPQPDC